MREFGLFNTLVVDERAVLVQFGPSPHGEWITIEGWGDEEWQVLIAIVSHPLGACEHDVVRHARGRCVVDRKTVYRIRERFRVQPDMPSKLADSIIRTRKGTSTYILNPEIKLQKRPGRIIGVGEHGEPRAFDTVLQSIKRSGLELFGTGGVRKAIDLLPDDVRRETVETEHEPGRWIPVRHISSWIKAMREGPAAFSLGDYKEFLRTMEHNRLLPYFDRYIRSSRTHRLRDIQQQWRTCYDSGNVEALMSADNDWYEIRLWNHPFLNNEMARWTHGFCWLSLSEALGAKDCALDICEVEELTGALRIRISGTLPDEE